MTWALDTPVHAGGVTCISIVETAVSVKGGPARIAAHATKRPVLFLLFRDGDVRGMDLCGHVLDAESVERDYAGAIAKAKTQVT